jgi:hypothetical protein
MKEPFDASFCADGENAIPDYMFGGKWLARRHADSDTFTSPAPRGNNMAAENNLLSSQEESWRRSYSPQYDFFPEFKSDKSDA